MRARVVEQNQLGGINGIRLELVSLDDEGDVETSRRRAREMAIDPLVVAAIGGRIAAEPLASAGLPTMTAASAVEANAAMDALLGALATAERAGSVDRRTVLEARR